VFCKYGKDLKRGISTKRKTPTKDNFIKGDHIKREPAKEIQWNPKVRALMKIMD